VPQAVGHAVRPAILARVIGTIVLVIVFAAVAVSAAFFLVKLFRIVR